MQRRHLTLVVLSIFFPVLKASRRRENSIYIAYWDVPKNCLSFKWDKDAAQYSLGQFQVLELAGVFCDWKWDGNSGLGT